MNKFRFKFSIVVLIFLFAIIIMSVGGLIANIVFLKDNFSADTIKLISFILSIIVNIALFIFSLAILIYSVYVIKKDNLIVRFGFFSKKIKIKDIVAFTHFTKTNTLVCYFNDNKYTVIVISPRFYDDFVIRVREKNTSIVYNNQIDGEDTPN